MFNKTAGSSSLSNTSLFVSFICVYFSQTAPSFIVSETTESNYPEFACGTKTIDAETGSMSSDFRGQSNNSILCDTFISVETAMFIEINFHFLYTESINDINMINSMCSSDYVEVLDRYQSWKICGDWNSQIQMLHFVFNTTSVRVKMIAHLFPYRARFKLSWRATVARNTIRSQSCAEPLLETEAACYELVSHEYDWLTSEDICRKRGGTLARIDTVATQAALEQLMRVRDVTSVWIGAHDRIYEGDYMWADRSAVVVSNWFPGWRSGNNSRSRPEPSDDGLAGEDCVEMRRTFPIPGEKGLAPTDAMYWNDRNCAAKNPFICQHDKQKVKRSAAPEPIDCSRHIRLTPDQPSEALQSPGFPDPYPRLASCHVIVTAPFGSQIFVDFLHFQLENATDCEYDNVTINSIPSSVGSPVIFCGDWNSRLKALRWTSDVNNVIISFKSDNSKQMGGFNVTVSLINQQSRCRTDISYEGPVVFGPGGCWNVLESNSNKSDAAIACEAFGGHMVDDVIDNKDFIGALLSTNVCRDVWIRAPSNVLANTCQQVRVCKSQRSGETGSDVMQSWNATLINTSCTTPGVAICRAQAKAFEGKQVSEVIITDASGSIDLFCVGGSNYSHGQLLVHQFRASSGHRIVFEFHNYDIEWQEDCLYDFLETRGMVADRRLCGLSAVGTVFVSVGNNASVVFSADDDKSACGFNLSWNTLNANSALPLQYLTDTNQTGVVQTLNFPNAFPDTLEGCVDIDTKDNYRIILEITNISFSNDIHGKHVLNITSVSGGYIKAFTAGARFSDLTESERLFVADDGARLCVHAERLSAGEGFRAQFEMVPKNETNLKVNIALQPNEWQTISTILYPTEVPTDLTQTTVISTALGYSLTVSLNILADPDDQRCVNASLHVFDTSIDASGVSLATFTCKVVLETGANVKFSSFLNSLTLVLFSGNQRNSTPHFHYYGNVTTVKDDTYIEKTKNVSGTLDRCPTCQNGGNCTETGSGRFRCACSSPFTGLFCQTTHCELSPCLNGTCSHDDAGFTCTCFPGYGGKRCQMDLAVCGRKFCSGRGQCNISTNDTISCLCAIEYKGETCMELVQYVTSKTEETIGQKLLKEPIWIGLIVIINLILFFVVACIVRRKCGTRILEILPSWKSPVSSPKVENSSPNATERSVSVSMETSRHTGTPLSGRPSVSIITAHVHRINDTSNQTTPVLDKGNCHAALKLFASYNSQKEENVTPGMASIEDPDVSMAAMNVCDLNACGIKGGSFSLPRDSSFGLRPHGIMRSFTDGADMPDLETKRQTFFTDGHRVSSFGGMPTRGSPSNAGGFESSTSPQNAKLNAYGHCYPEVKIINEHNVEQQIIGATAIEIKDFGPYLTSEASPVDSGYPSTVKRSSNRGSIESQTSQRSRASASTKRKLFGAKSSSFYNIGSLERYRMPEVDEARQLSAPGSSTNTRLSWDRWASVESENCKTCRKLNSMSKNNVSFNSHQTRRPKLRPSHYSYDCRRRHKYRRHRANLSCSCCFDKRHGVKYNRRNFPLATDSYTSRSHSCARTSSSTESDCTFDLYRGAVSDTENICRRQFVTSSRRSRQQSERLFVKPLDYKSKMMNVFLDDVCNESHFRERLNSDTAYSRFSHPMEGMSSVKLGTSHREHSKRKCIAKPPSTKVTMHFGDELLPEAPGSSVDQMYGKARNHGDGKKASDSDESKASAGGVSAYQTQIKDRDSAYQTIKDRDSAYQTQQQSLDRFKEDRICLTSGSYQDKSSNGNIAEERVKQHLYQAALKLAMIQNKPNASKDSAVIVSEDELSTDDSEHTCAQKSAVGRRTSLGLMFQLAEMTLSQVKEELSGVSKDSDSYPTPNNEPASSHMTSLNPSAKTFDSHLTANNESASIHMTQLNPSAKTFDIMSMALEETLV